MQKSVGEQIAREAWTRVVARHIAQLTRMSIARALERIEAIRVEFLDWLRATVSAEDAARILAVAL